MRRYMVVNFWKEYVESNFLTLDDLRNLHEPKVASDILEYIQTEHVGNNLVDNILNETEKNAFYDIINFHLFASDIKKDLIKSVQEIEDTVDTYTFKVQSSQFSHICYQLAQNLTAFCEIGMAYLQDGSLDLEEMLLTVISCYKRCRNDVQKPSLAIDLFRSLIDFTINKKVMIGKEVFFRTIEEMFPQALEMILKIGQVDVNCKSVFGKSAVHYILNSQLPTRDNNVNEREECMEILLANGYKMDVVDMFGNTPYHFMAKIDEHCKDQQSLFNKISEQLEGSIESSQQNIFGLTPLHMTIHYNFNRTLYDTKKTFEYFCSCDSVNKLDLNHQSPLHFASANVNSVDLCEQLLQCGADVKQPDKNSITPMHLAAAVGDNDVISLLIEENANINATDCYGHTPLVYAVANNQLEFVESLLSSYVQMDKNLFQNLFSIARFNGHEISVDTLEEVLNENNIEVKEIFEADQEDVSCFSCLPCCQIFTTRRSKENSTSQMVENVNSVREFEFQEILREMRLLLKRASQLLHKEQDPFSFTPVLSGSVSEGTKIGFLSEVDFLCYLENLTRHNSLTVLKNDDRQNFAQIRIETASHKDYGVILFPNSVSCMFRISVLKVLSRPEISKDLHLYFVCSEVDNFEGQIVTLEFKWFGENLKDFPISVDLVPTIYIDNYENAQPSNLARLCDLLEVEVEKNRTYLVTKVLKTHLMESDNSLWRISFSPIETLIFQKLCTNYKSVVEGYKLTKRLRDDSDVGSRVVSSYVLKTCLFYKLLDILEGRKDIACGSAVSWATKLLEKLESLLISTGNVPHFFFDATNLVDYKGPVLQFCQKALKELLNLEK